MFAEPSTATGLFLLLSVNDDNGLFYGFVDRVEIHPVGWGEALIVLEAAQPVVDFTLYALGDMPILSIGRRPFPALVYERHVGNALNDSCLMAHGVVLDLLWYLQRMRSPDGRWLWSVEEAMPLLYDKWITGQEFALADFEGR